MARVPIPENINCPHCGKPLGLNLVSKLASESRVSITLKPEVGSFLSTGTVGGSIEALGNLLDAFGADLGVKSNTLVEGISCKGGAIKVDLLITRLETAAASHPTEGAETNA